MRLLLLFTLLIGACASPPGQAPSLAPRLAEAIDPRLPVRAEPVIGAPSPALAARLAELVAIALAGDAEFNPAAAEAERLAATAGAAQSERWIAAQQALSAAVAARGDTARALGDIDALVALPLQDRGSIPPDDLGAIEAAAAEVAAIDRRQAARVEAVVARLGG